MIDMRIAISNEPSSDQYFEWDVEKKKLRVSSAWKVAQEEEEHLHAFRKFYYGAKREEK